VLGLSRRYGTLLCFAAPLTILALAYAWLALAHGTLRLWQAQVHETGRYTLVETVLFQSLAEIPVDVGMALFLRRFR
jgi:hypothetical protein